MQEWIVAVAVVLAALYAVWSFMPANWRRQVATRLGLPGAASLGSCHACDECGSCGAPDALEQDKRGKLG
ncbi:MAG: hypothetical protein I8H77_17905 [Comamonadaceae bacterium]|nr:hypothetical protein [Comamonadaceae bacterium]